MTRLERIGRQLRDLLDARIVVLDGAMGTLLQQADLAAEDFGAPAAEGCHEALVRTRPDLVRAVHDVHLGAGADIIKTNTFGGTSLVLEEYGLGEDTYALNLLAAQLARAAADAWATPGRPRFVAGAMGPTTRAISVTGGVTFTELYDAFYEQARALIDGGVDLLLLETCQDTRNVKAALLAIERLSSRAGRISVMVSATLEPSGTMLGGQAVDAFCASLGHADLLALGLNCSRGPEFLAAHVSALSACSPTYVSCHPNAGLPDETGRYTQTPEAFASRLASLLERGMLNIAGGCCGTTGAHIAALAQAAASARPRTPGGVRRRSCLAGIDLVPLDEGVRPILIGERANVVGSRAFKRLIAAGQWDEAVDVAREQVRHGARVIDVCLQSADRDECGDIPPFYERLIRSVRTPIMIDTTDVTAMELALTCCQGKSLVNSVNLEDGGHRLAQACRLVRSYGGALVIGCIDDDAEQPQAFTRERKLAVAERACERACHHGVPLDDLVVDPLVFPCATGDPAYIGAAAETIAAIPLIKQALPSVRTVLGISNVSFGLPAAARRVVDSVFLHHCVLAGLDLAMVNAAAVLPYASIPGDERRLAEHLLFNRPAADAADEVVRGAPDDWRAQSPEQRAAIARHAVAAITDRFRAATPAAVPAREDLPLEARLARYVVEGAKSGLVEDLDRMRAEGAAPLDIINGPLMAGMGEVARRFKAGELIVAEVLRSAEVMRAAVRHLEQFLDPADTTTRGTVVLATVKGDVHDIGKDLVKVILSNNGYRVVDLGTRVPPEALIDACRQHRPAAVGLSGLLVKSAHQMAVTASAFAGAGLDVPLLVGGAALSQQFARTHIAPAYGGQVHYAPDAMTGLALMNEIAASAPAREPGSAASRAPAPSRPAPAGTAAPAAGSPRATRVRTGVPVPILPYAGRETVRPRVAEVWPYLNPFMLYNRHLGFRGDLPARVAQGDPTAIELVRFVAGLQEEVAPFMDVKAVWRFFEAERAGNVLHLFEHGAGSPLQSFRFDRQPSGARLCLSDYVLDPQDGRRDQVAAFVATAGAGIRARADVWSAAGEFLKAHALQALALETAEACAEWLHRRIRRDWGFPDPPGTTPADLFTSRYRGKRYSFGYPACPNLDDQRGIWRLLQPDDIGVALTESMMMDPEASVSGLVFHHPDCEYFAVEDRAAREARV